MSLNYSFSGKNVLITGGGSGIGRLLVQRLYEDGATVFTVDKNAEAILELKKEFPNIKAEVLDLGNWNETTKVIETFSKIDHLVNNAGVFVKQKFLEITEEAVAEQYNVNFGAIINVSQVVARKLIESGSGGSIVNISSMSSQRYIPGLNVYGSSKAAVTMLTKSMACDLAEHGIRVNAIQPGAVDTPLNRLPNGQLFEHVERWMEHSAFKRLIESKEITDLVLFLLSPLSSGITGEAVTIDGGWMR